MLRITLQGVVALFFALPPAAQPPEVSTSEGEIFLVVLSEPSVAEYLIQQMPEATPGQRRQAVEGPSARAWEGNLRNLQRRVAAQLEEAPQPAGTAFLRSGDASSVQVLERRTLLVNMLIVRAPPQFAGDDPAAGGGPWGLPQSVLSAAHGFGGVGGPGR